MEENTLKIPTPKYRSGDIVAIQYQSPYSEDWKLDKAEIKDTTIHIKRNGQVVIRYNVGGQMGSRTITEDHIPDIPTLEEYE